VTELFEQALERPRKERSEFLKSACAGDSYLPITIVIDRDGNVREVIEGILLPEEFDEKIKPLLSKASVSETPSSRLESN
jgi:hypothetical protein